MEQFSYWLQAIISILSGLAIVIPLAVELVKFIKASVKGKNWPNVLSLVMKLMAEAETQFEIGEEKKQFVMNELRAISSTLNYDIDWDVISTLIDTLCDLSKKVNVRD